uniref:cAMP-regulated phosphoprotein 19-related protein n=1 Tax=Kalanchoe fedtschenkoi TaxID=63787 RepID=A0A7N0UD85_KALFE
MSGTTEKANEQGIDSGVPMDQTADVVSGDHNMKAMDDEHPMPTPEQEEEALKKKYGGIIPKKKPLISKDHERAFFDSADWALGKQGKQKPKGPLEALRPKLQPTPHQQARARRSTYASSDGNDDIIASHEGHSTTSETGQSESMDISMETRSGHE